MKKCRISLKRMVMPILLISVLFPSIRLFDGLPAIRLEFIIVNVLWILILMSHLASIRGKQLKWHPVYNWFVIFGITIFVSIIYSMIFHGRYPIRRDFFEFVRLAKYFLIFALITNLNIVPRDMMRNYFISIFIFTCLAVIAYAQFFNIMNINEILFKYYAPTQIEGFVISKRITGTTGNPNEFSALMVIACSLSLTGSLWLEGKVARLVSFSAFIVFSIAVVLSLSRSGLIILIVAVIYILLKCAIYQGIWKAIRVYSWIIPIFVILIFAIIQIIPGRLFRLADLQDFAVSTSWHARLLMWDEALTQWLRHPLFGWGPAKDSMTTIVDNEWLLLLRRYGIIGTAVFLLWFGSIYLKFAKISHASNNNYVRVFSISLQATLIAYAVFMMTAGVYHLLQLMTVLIIYLGLAYSQGISSKKLLR